MIRAELRAQFRSQHLDATHVAAGFQSMTDPGWRLETSHHVENVWGREKPQRCLEELATVSPLQGPGNISTFGSGRCGRPRVSGRRMTLNSQSPRQLRHRQKTSLSNDFFPEPATVQIKLWESGNTTETLRKQPFLLRWVLNFAFFQREKLG